MAADPHTPPSPASGGGLSPAEALRAASAQFRFYERQHNEKGTKDGRTKAAVNASFAETMEQACALALAATRTDAAAGWADITLPQVRAEIPVRERYREDDSWAYLLGKVNAIVRRRMAALPSADSFTARNAAEHAALVVEAGGEGLREGVWKTTTVRTGEPDLVQWRAWSKARGEAGMFANEAAAWSALGDDTRSVLAELAALVRGECPSLLNEDSGGDADLDARIDAALTSPQPAKEPDPIPNYATRIEAPSAFMRGDFEPAKEPGAAGAGLTAEPSAVMIAAGHEAIIDADGTDDVAAEVWRAMYDVAQRHPAPGRGGEAGDAALREDFSELGKPDISSLARKAISAFDDLVAESGGVYGLHLNGDEAPWSDLIAGGRYEEWTSDMEALRAALAPPDAPPRAEGDANRAQIDAALKAAHDRYAARFSDAPASPPAPVAQAEEALGAEELEPKALAFPDQIRRTMRIQPAQGEFTLSRGGVEHLLREGERAFEFWRVLAITLEFWAHDPDKNQERFDFARRAVSAAAQGSFHKSFEFLERAKCPMGPWPPTLPAARASRVAGAKETVRAFIDSAEVSDVLRWMCFQVIPIVRALRASGVEIKRRAEDEQEAAMRWMLHHVAESGPDWRKAADADLNARRAALGRPDAAGTEGAE